MEREVGEVFKYNGVTLIIIENKNNSCKECFFNINGVCTMDINKVGFCSASCRDDDKNVTFRKVEDMETRTIKLTLEKAKEFYNKGGEFRDLALSAFTEEELQEKTLPNTWDEFCSKYGVQNEYYIGSDSIIRRAPLNNFRLTCKDRNLLPDKQAAERHLALMQLHQLRDCYRQGWEPDWSEGEDKYCIVYNNSIHPNTVNNYSIAAYTHARTFLSFQSEEIARLFLKTFRSLIEEAGDLI